jgi:NDP-sugar pyrophosphorylase family protein
MKAIILAAGRGQRLRPITDTVPKCLVPVNGRPILEYQLAALSGSGIRKCVVVVGYLASQIEQRFGSSYGGMGISYVFNPEFSSTNNIYSLWLARHEVDDDILLLEGDLLFEKDIIADLLNARLLDTAVLDNFDLSMDGTVVIPMGNQAVRMVLKANQTAGFDYSDALKTVNIYTFSKATISESILPSAGDYISSGQRNQFYEAVIANLIDRGDLTLGIHLANGRLWREIDTPDDLIRAEADFQEASLSWE